MNNPTTQLIKQTRKDAGLTQTKAAELVQSSLRSWQEWEQGKSKMKAGLWELFLSKITKADIPF